MERRNLIAILLIAVVLSFFIQPATEKVKEYAVCYKYNSFYSTVKQKEESGQYTRPEVPNNTIYAPFPLVEQEFMTTEGSMYPTLHLGDTVLMDTERELHLGDIISYSEQCMQDMGIYKCFCGSCNYVMHRIVYIDNNCVVTKGDSNPSVDSVCVPFKCVLGNKNGYFVGKYVLRCVDKNCSKTEKLPIENFKNQ